VAAGYLREPASETHYPNNEAVHENTYFSDNPSARKIKKARREQWQNQQYLTQSTVHRVGWTCIRILLKPV
jgi:hypothetical protein